MTDIIPIKGQYASCKPTNNQEDQTMFTLPFCDRFITINSLILQTKNAPNIQRIEILIRGTIMETIYNYWADYSLSDDGELYFLPLHCFLNELLIYTLSQVQLRIYTKEKLLKPKLYAWGNAITDPQIFKDVEMTQNTTIRKNFATTLCSENKGQLTSIVGTITRLYFKAVDNDGIEIPIRSFQLYDNSGIPLLPKGNAWRVFNNGEQFIDFSAFGSNETGHYFDGHVTFKIKPNLGYEFPRIFTLHVEALQIAQVTTPDLDVKFL